LFDFAAVALVRVAVETRHCCQAAASLGATQVGPQQDKEDEF